MTVELVADAKATLGEGPCWDASSQTLYWVDILGQRLYAGTEIMAVFDEPVGCAVPCLNGHFIVGVRSAILDFDPASGTKRTVAELHEPSNNRVNDGKCDPSGRLLVGTMDMDNERDPTGSLYSLDGEKLMRLRSDQTIANGLTWSPDHQTFYHIDTPTREVVAFDYDLDTGRISNPRVAVRVPQEMGWPDGMTSDQEGRLWIAMWGGGQVTQWNPHTGQLLRRIAVPALHSSSCAFGGPKLNELYITSARKGLNPAQLAEYPLSGGLFRVVTDTVGSPTYAFG